MSALTPAFPAFDQPAAEAFAERFVDILNGGAVAVMASIGHRAGLFDAMTGLPPSSSQTIAERAGLAERYVREWLAVMVTGRIVTYDAARSRPTTCRPSMPPSWPVGHRSATSPCRRSSWR